LAGLAGCGSQPDDGQAREALGKKAEAAEGAPLSKDRKVALAQVKIVKCAKADAGGYQCDMVDGGGAAWTERFVKTDSGWVAMQR